MSFKLTSKLMKKIKKVWRIITNLLTKVKLKIEGSRKSSLRWGQALVRSHLILMIVWEEAFLIRLCLSWIRMTWVGPVSWARKVQIVKANLISLLMGKVIACLVEGSYWRRKHRERIETNLSQAMDHREGRVTLIKGWLSLKITCQGMLQLFLTHMRL